MKKKLFLVAAAIWFVLACGATSTPFPTLETFPTISSKFYDWQAQEAEETLEAEEHWMELEATMEEDARRQEADFDRQCCEDEFCREASPELCGGSVLSQCPEGCASHPPGCDIKGNISIDSQEKIYHVLGQKYYEKTKIDPEYGERWFCTEEEARANGWRKAMQ